MEQKEIQKIWRGLLVPFIIGLIVFIVSLLFHRLGSKRPGPQTLSFFGCILGLVFIIFPGLKMLRFKKYLKSLNDSDKENAK